MILGLARPPAARLLRTPLGWLWAAAWCALAVGAALLTRREGASHGADRVLLGAYAGLALPLLTYSVVGTVVGGRSLPASIAPLVGFGASPTRATLVSIGVCAATCVLLGAALAATVALIAHGVADPPRGHDAATSAYAGALGGGAYAAWFSLGAVLGRRGGGRATLLVLDWVIGTGQGATALLSPRSHVRNLLGGSPPMDLAGRLSATILVVLAIACALVAARRAGVMKER